MKTLIIVFLSLFSISSLAQEKILIFNLKDFEFIAMEANGDIVKRGQASGGRRWCPDIKQKCKTKPGMYRVISKKGKYYRSSLYPLFCNNKSKNVKERCASMAYAIKFIHSGESIHASNDNWKKPKNISHGCLHVPFQDAKFLNEYLNIGDKVVILPY